MLRKATAPASQVMDLVRTEIAPQRSEQHMYRSVPATHAGGGEAYMKAGEASCRSRRLSILEKEHAGAENRLSTGYGRGELHK